MANFDQTQNIMYQEEFDLKAHWCNFNRFQNTTHPVSEGSEYYVLDGIQSGSTTSDSTQYTALHINIQSLSAKFDELKLVIASLQERGIKLDYIMICETFLHDNNHDLFKIPGYNFEHKSRKQMRRGGVCIYINEAIQYKLRDDLAIFVEGEFESIFIETTNTVNNTVVGEIYRVPNSNIAHSLEHFNTILSMLSRKQDIILGTDQNLNLLMSDSHAPTSELLNIMFTHTPLPTITKPTRITHTSATLIDNIYLKVDSNTKIHSGIILTDISDHLPIFCFITINKKNTRLHEPLILEHRKITESTLNLIRTAINSTSWSYLNDLDTNNAFNIFTETLNDIVDFYAPIKKVRIPSNYIKRDPG